MFSAVIFDLDGTLVESEAVRIAVAAEVYREADEAIDHDFLLSLVGVAEPDARARIAARLKGGGHVDDYEAEIKRRVRAEFTESGIPLRAGAVSLIESLSARAMPLAIATSSRRESAEWKLTRAGLRQHFQVVVALEDVVAPKPSPDAYLQAAAALGIAPENCLVFEDSDPGVAAAKAAGMKVVQVPDLSAPTALMADVVAESLLDGARAVGLAV